MDHLSCTFSLLLIVSITTTTLGSAIKPKNPNGGELEALLEPSYDSKPRMNSRYQDSVKEKRLDPGTVIAGASLGISVLKDILAAIGSVQRKVAIGIDNESGFKWESPTHYFSSGTSDQNLPYRLNNGKAVLYTARKRTGSLKGAVGVVAFHVPGIRRTVAVMYSVPYSYVSRQNRWNVKLYTGKKRADRPMFRDLYNHKANPFKANGWHERDLGSNYKFRGVMSSSGQSTLEIHVLKK